VLHVFDHGKAFSCWLGLLFAFQLRFVLRWKKEYPLVEAQGQRRGPERTVWDCRRPLRVRASILALPVPPPDHPEPALWLVIARRKGGLPCSRLPNEPISSVDDAWRIMVAYARSLQMELPWREHKSA
jgi:hypothetical protein